METDCFPLLLALVYLEAQSYSKCDICRSRSHKVTPQCCKVQWLPVAMETDYFLILLALACLEAQTNSKCDICRSRSHKVTLQSSQVQRLTWRRITFLCCLLLFVSEFKDTANVIAQVKVTLERSNVQWLPWRRITFLLSRAMLSHFSPIVWIDGYLILRTFSVLP